eukprot:10618254-Alexandrium_andersonii.AAC.1
MLRRIVLELVDFPEFLLAVKFRQRILLLKCHPDKSNAPDRVEVTKEINGLIEQIHKQSATLGITVGLAEMSLRRKFPDRIAARATTDGRENLGLVAEAAFWEAEARNFDHGPSG